MKLVRHLYGHSLGLLTDLYQLTMAYGYWKTGMADKESVFHLFFRHNPFKSGYAVACGLSFAVDFLDSFSFSRDDVAYLGELRGNDGKKLFHPDFLTELSNMKFSCDLEAVEEGTVVFPHEPLLRVKGPILQCQILETPLLNLINFQTLIATKAARMVWAAQGDPILEFGLRRAQGIDGALSASYAAHVGGCDATSNVLAGKLFGIPVRGTHAHSWVMCFDDEPTAFETYASAMPNNCVFLVDTYDTLSGVEHAIEIGRRLRRQGHEMIGIRLDSGDLAYLSIKAREMLDQAGFPDATIVASNDLDDDILLSLKRQGARIDVWGVGTRLVTAYDQPALGGVYKLTAIRDAGAAWKHKIKLSEQSIKISTPGILGVRRFKNHGHFIGDQIYDEILGIHDPYMLVDPMDATRRKKIQADAEFEELLSPLFRAGKYIGPEPSLTKARNRAAHDLSLFHDGIKRRVNPHQYPVGLEIGLHRLKSALVLEARGFSPES